MKTSVTLILVILAVAANIKARHTKNKHTKDEESGNTGLNGPQDFPGSGGLGGPQGPQGLGAGDWPNPGSVSNYGVPDAFTQASGSGSSDSNGKNESSSDSGKQHGKSHHKSRRN